MLMIILAALLFVGQAHAQYIATHPIFAVVQSTASAFLKGGTGRYISMRGEAVGSTTTYPWITFDTQTGGTATNGLATSSRSQVYTSGWYRVTMTFVANGGTGGNIAFAGSDVATAPGTTNVLGNAYTGTSLTRSVWGAQLEQGYAPTSYIATTSSAVTRAAEVAYVPVVGLKGINGNTGSLFGQMIYEACNPGQGSRLLALNDGTNPNVGTEWGFYTVQTYPPSLASTVANNATGAASGLLASVTSGLSIRAALTFNQSRLDVAANATATLNTAMLPSYTPRTLTILNFNQPERYQSPASLWFQRVTYYPAYLGPNWATGKSNGTIP